MPVGAAVFWAATDGKGGAAVEFRMVDVMPPTGEGFSRPLSCAVYICGGCTEVEVSGLRMPYPPFIVWRLAEDDSLERANESMYARGTADGADPK